MRAKVLAYILIILVVLAGFFVWLYFSPFTDETTGFWWFITRGLVGAFGFTTIVNWLKWIDKGGKKDE